MLDTYEKLNNLLIDANSYISAQTDVDFNYKKTSKKWSKKEILGHLIDSGINNLQRFTEIQFKPKPYKIIAYRQNELVIANNYQKATIQELLNFWLTINYRILNILKQLDQTSLQYKIVLEDTTIMNLEFLITDYITHLEHHLQQIKS